jgi:hypothetical protein
MTTKTGFTDNSGLSIELGDTIEIKSTTGTMRMKIVHLNEEGYHGFYAEQRSGSRTLRIALWAIKECRLVEL